LKIIKNSSEAITRMLEGSHIVWVLNSAKERSGFARVLQQKIDKLQVQGVTRKGYIFKGLRGGKITLLFVPIKRDEMRGIRVDFTNYTRFPERTYDAQ